jgi:hypothetical protein
MSPVHERQGGVPGVVEGHGASELVLGLLSSTKPLMKRFGWKTRSRPEMAVRSN